ncbi:Nn.00g114080.m01.CDS01 [Neocucurbitaria sp. VM-36]
MFGHFALQWRAPSPNPPEGTPLLKGITRTYVQTVSGPLELLVALPTDSSSAKPPLFFAHGGFGCAYRGHGKSWYPGFWQMYFTSRGEMGEDLVAGIEEAGRLESERRKSEEKIRVVLISHSAGGALSQYVLSRGLCTVTGFCMFAAVPGFGSWSCYKFWFLSAPLNFYYRLCHSRYLLATTKQVHDAFFSYRTPVSVIKQLEYLLAPYESMCWPMQVLSAFVTGPDVIQHITGWMSGKSSSANAAPAGIAPRFLVLAAEEDVLCTPAVLLDAAKRYRATFYHCIRTGKLGGVSESDARFEVEDGENWNGVSLKMVKGVAHHSQNDVEWQKGAKVVLEWAERL